MVALPKRGCPSAHFGAEGSVEQGYDDVRGGKSDASVGREAVMGHPVMTLARIHGADPESSNGTTAEHGSRVDRVASGGPGEAPPSTGAEVPRSLDHHRDISLQGVHGGEQAGVHGHRLEITAVRLTDGHRADDPARQAQARDGV
ncbi:MAG: hypothetical protein QOG53_2729 [Frankiales bacterium]|nr:hypothetical protein [Frankiales bacterium]